VDDSADILARCATREIILFIGKPKGRSIMISAVRPRLLQAAFVLRRITWFQGRQRS